MNDLRDDYLPTTGENVNKSIGDFLAGLLMTGLLTVCLVIDKTTLLGPKPPAPVPAPCPGPGPCPVPAPPPKKPLVPRPWGTLDADGRPLVGAITVGGPVAPDGVTEVQTDLPVSERKKNVGGRDGAGLCVFTSIGHAAAFQNERRLLDFQEKMRKELGGGYPSKVDTMIAKYGPGTPYVQYEGNDLGVLRMALESGRMPSITYNGRDPHYGSRTVAHMVNLVYLDMSTACVLDNNFVGENELVWMTAEEFKSRWLGGRQGWMVCLLKSPPPAPARN